jgi:hypothetical protein
MKPSTALAVCVGFAVFAASSATFAASAPATPPPKPQKLTVVPPPPPPSGGPGHLATPTKPSKTGPAVIVIFPSPGAKPPAPPKPIDDFAGTGGPKEGPVVIGSHIGGPVRPPSPPTTPGTTQLAQ